MSGVISSFITVFWQDGSSERETMPWKRVENKPTKEEYAVAKFLRFNIPVREGRLVGMTVQCFYANKAIDALLESKWSASKRKKEPLFTNRSSCISYCNRLLQKGLFHRAQKTQRSKDRDKTKKKKKLKEGEKEEESVEETVRERKKKDKKGKKDVDLEKVDDEGKEESGKKEEKKDEEKKKKEKKLKLSMHDDQRFVDGDEVYVWIYDPVPLKTFLIGLLMLLGAIALCLFPLWPEEVRVGVYYISLAAAGFVGFILSLVIVRLILFCIVWVITIGKHHFWFLPNLTEDVGFFDSFKPLYTHDSGGKETEKSKDKKVKDSEHKEKKIIDSGGKGDSKAIEVEKDENSGSDKSENGEFELVSKEEIAEGETEEDLEGKTTNDEDIEEEIDEEIDEDENDFDENDKDMEDNEGKKDK